MSTQAVIDFLEAVAGNQDLARQLDQVEQSGLPPIAHAVATAGNHGFTFTASEYVRVLAARRASAEDALAEDELERVAGGARDILLGSSSFQSLPPERRGDLAQSP